MQKCPHCQAESSDTAQECSKCGILFSKWTERENNVASGNLSKYNAIANATSSEFNWTILAVIAIAVAGVLFFFAQHAKEVVKNT